MARVLLTDIVIDNLGPIIGDKVDLHDFTFFVGRNNAGKSHYMKGIELLLSSGTKKTQIPKWQRDKSKPITIEGTFKGVSSFLELISVSNHRKAIESEISNDTLCVIATLDPEEGVKWGIKKSDGTIHNPGGFSGNLLKILPDVIYIPATADTVQELADKSTTALGKLKKEVMSTFFQELASKTESVLTTLDEFLHSEEEGVRSQAIIDFESGLQEEFMGEFSDVKPSVEFGLPDESVIAKEMKIYLDDGNKTEIEQKGHGLQRAALLSLLKLLAKKGERYQNCPPPIFLIGELESFLHPYAQREMANALIQMMKSYQIVTTTHSPFIITAETIEGYRRVKKDSSEGTKNITFKSEDDIDISLIKRLLERKGNLEGLFADRVILVEGNHDENFFEILRTLFNLTLPERKLTLFVKSEGKESLRVGRKFYKQMCFEDIAIICDLDYAFCNDIKNLLRELEIDEDYPDKFREHIDWSKEGDPPLDYILDKIEEKGRPEKLEEFINKLKEHRIFVLLHGAPEHYYKNENGRKSGWSSLQSDEDLLEPEYLKELMTAVLS